MSCSTSEYWFSIVIYSTWRVPFHWICFVLGSQLKIITRFYFRLTIDSQSPHNCFPIVSRFSRAPGDFILETNSQLKLDSTSDSQSTHNRLTIVWSMFGSHVYTVLWERFSSMFTDFEREHNDVHQISQNALQILNVLIVRNEKTLFFLWKFNMFD